jgi:hypothetical protein
LAALLAGLVVAGVSQAGAPPPDAPFAKIDDGVASGHTYANRALGFSTGFPDGWDVVPAASYKSRIEQNHEAEFEDSPASDPAHERTWRCTHILLWTTNERKGGTLMVMIWDPGCFPEVKFPDSSDDHDRIQRSIEGMRRPPFGQGKYILGPDEKVTTSVLQGHLLLDISAKMSEGEATTYISTVVTPVKNYWLGWMLQASSQAGLQNLKKATLSSVKFDLP